MKKCIDVYAHCTYSPNQPNRATSLQPMNKDPYAENRTTLYLDPALTEIAKAHFKTTRYRSLSGFVDSQMRRELRRQSPKLRKRGVKLPETLFRD